MLGRPCLPGRPKPLVVGDDFRMRVEGLRAHERVLARLGSIGFIGHQDLGEQRRDGIARMLQCFKVAPVRDRRRWIGGAFEGLLVDFKPVAFADVAVGPGPAGAIGFLRKEGEPMDLVVLVDVSHGHRANVHIFTEELRKGMSGLADIDHGHGIFRGVDANARGWGQVMRRPLARLRGLLPWRGPPRLRRRRRRTARPLQPTSPSGWRAIRTGAGGPVHSASSRRAGWT